MNNNQLFNEVKIMKKIFYQIMGLCSILGVATACNEDPEYFTLDEQPDEMHIVASTDKLVLDKGKGRRNCDNLYLGCLVVRSMRLT